MSRMALPAAAAAAGAAGSGGGALPPLPSPLPSLSHACPATFLPPCYPSRPRPPSTPFRHPTTVATTTVSSSSSSSSSSRRRARSRGALACTLTVLRPRTLKRLLPAQFTGDQWKYYWGITESDKFGKIYEAASSTFFGLWTSWFLTFLIGLPAATILGTVFLFYWILAPGLAAYRRNISFRGTYFARHPRDDGIFGALFSGRVVRVGRITQSREYNRPEAMVMCVEDEQGRKLRVYAPVQPSYKKVRPGMRCEGLVLSESATFDELLGVSDMFVPACGAWVGDYPYLDKVQFKAFLAAKLERERERRKQGLQRMKAGLLGSGGGAGGRGGDDEEGDEDGAMPMDFVLEGMDEEGKDKGELLPIYSRGDEEVYASMWEPGGGRGGGKSRPPAYDDEDEEEEDDDEDAVARRVEERRRERRRRFER